MDIAASKFASFKVFLDPFVTDTTYTIALRNISFDSFLRLLSRYKDQAIDDIVTDICGTFDIDISDNKYSQEDKDRAKRYLSYFIEIIKVYNNNNMEDKRI